MSEAAKVVKEEKEFDHHPIAGRWMPHADPDRSQRRDAKGPGRQAPRQGGVHARQVRVFRAAVSTRPIIGCRLPLRFPKNSKLISQGQPEDAIVTRARAGDRRDPRSLRGDGLCLGRKSDGATPALKGEWKPFSDAGLLPDPSSLFLIARAITPPGRVRRFDTRFSPPMLPHRPSRRGVIHADAELVELVWVEIGFKTAGRSAPYDQKRSERTGKAPRHRAAEAQRGGAVFSVSMAAGMHKRCVGRGVIAQPAVIIRESG